MASVTVDGQQISNIGYGMMVLLGVKCGDTEADAAYIADKIAGLRIFDDTNGVMNLSAQDVHAEVLLVSQFTLYGDARKGRRPSYIEAEKGESAMALYTSVVQQVAAAGIPVQTGEFGADMKVAIVNDGPVTILLDSAKGF